MRGETGGGEPGSAIGRLLDGLRRDERFMATVAAWRELPAQPARRAAFPEALHPAVVQVCRERGISELYTHQAQAVALALGGQHVAVVTPTASGKTLCYNLPVFDTLVRDPAARALYLFPTKALAHDQWAELQRWANDLDRRSAAAGRPSSLAAAAYDGDTPSAERPRIRKTARLLLTNPDMLHVGILPYHTQWADFLAGLQWVVLDEMHTYRGVFGSHVANVLRRLRRLCAHYGSAPHFVCTSATIANPQPLAQQLIEAPVTLVEENGAPRGARHVVLVNPPLIDPERGLRRSATLEATDLAARAVSAGVQTIVFGRSRLVTELLLSYLREKLVRGSGARPAVEWSSSAAEERPSPFSPLSVRATVRGYRGGYLPAERRTIEAGLRSGDVRAVVATNALELGIDIGQLQAAVLCGYPGAIASTWQQMGRAGRSTESALALLVATGGALDQFLLQHPEYLFDRSPEHALIHPDNLMLLLDQVCCAAFELPFAAGEAFGASQFSGDVLAMLAEQGEVQPHGDHIFWSGESYPARRVSLRSAGSDQVVIQAQSPAQDGGPAAARSPLVIGEVDLASAPLLVHRGAVYLHEGQSYLVAQLDLPGLRADVQAVEVDYYTEAATETEVAVLACHDAAAAAGLTAAWGDVSVRTQVIGYRRIKRLTHETLGVQSLDYPPSTVETGAYWFTVDAATQDRLERAGLWFDSRNDYGPNWAAQRQRVRARDHCRCRQCGCAEPPGQEHDVHHRIPFRTFGYVPGVNDNYLAANELDNLILVCRTCHQRLETAGRLRTGLDGLAYAVANLAPLFLMCDRGDLGVHVQRSGGSGQAQAGAVGPGLVQLSQSPGLEERSGSQPAAVYLYESVPAGLGFGEALFRLHDQILAAAHTLIAHCACARGCPACVGPVLDEQPYFLETKRLTLALLTELRAGAA